MSPHRACFTSFRTSLGSCQLRAALPTIQMHGVTHLCAPAPAVCPTVRGLSLDLVRYVRLTCASLPTKHRPTPRGRSCYRLTHARQTSGCLVPCTRPPGAHLTRLNAPALYAHRSFCQDLMSRCHSLHARHYPVQHRAEGWKRGQGSNTDAFPQASARIMPESLEGGKAPALYLPHRLLAYQTPAVRARRIRMTYPSHRLLAYQAPAVRASTGTDEPEGSPLEHRSTTVPSAPRTAAPGPRRLSPCAFG